MLTKPDCGWTNVSLGDDLYRASYLTDIPLDCANSMLSALKYDIPFCVSFDAEGWGFVIVCSPYVYYDTQIIIYKNTTDVESYNLTFEDFVKELYKDLYDNLDDWVLWDTCGDDESNQENDFRKCEMVDKLKQIKKLIDSKYNEKGDI